MPKIRAWGEAVRIVVAKTEPVPVAKAVADMAVVAKVTMAGVAMARVEEAMAVAARVDTRAVEVTAVAVPRRVEGATADMTTTFPTVKCRVHPSPTTVIVERT